MAASVHDKSFPLTTGKTENRSLLVKDLCLCYFSYFPPSVIKHGQC